MDAKELYKRLEVVARQQEARERRKARDSPPNVERGLSPSLNVDGFSTTSKEVPPPTAFPTRPTSFLPPTLDEPVPRSLQLSRLSDYGVPTDNVQILQSTLGAGPAFGPALATDLQEVGQAARLGAKTSSRPSTSWNAEDSPHDDDARLTISNEQRPKSASNAESLSQPVIVADGPVLVKRSSVEQLQDVSQMVQIINQAEPVAMVAPVTSVRDEPHAVALEPPVVALDGHTAVGSGKSSASTVAMPQPAASPRSERKSWNPKHLISRLKEKRSTSERIAPVISNMTAPTVTSLQEFVAEPFTPIQPNMSVSNQTTPAWEQPIPRARSTFEPFRFEDYRFSGTSDVLSVRASDPHSNFRLSDLDSGLGMSDTGSNTGEELPTLRPGAEKRAVESSALSKRESMLPVQFETEGTDSPVKKDYRESRLRREVPAEDAFDFDPTLNLSDEPPEDEGIFVNFPQQDAPLEEPEPELLPVPQFHETGAMSGFSTSNETTPEKEKARKREKRRTFDPRQLFSSKKSTTKDIEPVASSNRQNRNTVTLVSHTPTSTLSTRPSSRSQPIVIMAHHQEPIPTTNIAIYNAIPDTAAVRSSQSTIQTATASVPASTRSRASKPCNVLIIPHPPEVPDNEMKHMTPASVALLREQEKLLHQRATRQLAEAHIRDTERMFDEQGDEIGVAFSPSDPPAPTAVANKNGSVRSISQATSHNTQSRRLSSAQSARGLRDSYATPQRGVQIVVTPSPLLEETESVGAEKRRHASVNLPRHSVAHKLFSRNLPHATVSMVELDRSGRQSGASKRKSLWSKLWKK